MIDQTRIPSSSTAPPLSIQPSTVSKRGSDQLNNNSNNGNNNSNKRLNHLKVGVVKELSLDDKLEKLTGA